MKRISILLAALATMFFHGCETTESTKATYKRTVPSSTILGEDPIERFKTDQTEGKTYIYATINIPPKMSVPSNMKAFIKYPGLKEFVPSKYDENAEILHVFVQLEVKKLEDGRSVVTHEDLGRLEKFMSTYNQLSLRMIEKYHNQSVVTTPEAPPPSS
ncbi:hypothetical protein [Pelagicoccus mobilis]|uniref:Lipoprotein n=1 Tax=Pelagicoccus mobilis TaxID=415221 RepID=A0A934S8G5_9BACT|nr:hypothetical protein [Pelagicoccus mobilis]MBK1880758.1 hypothetical protein [Pelagicoccus mobilis]